jgi:ABC-type nitrate/sulfonate/bicarbonate transport system substrate-binding protein
LDRVELALLRGVCQCPAYVACARGYFDEQGLDVHITVQPTAWIVPAQIARGAIHFGVIPWTRVAAASAREEGLVLVCGSGCEEAALVLRAGVALGDVQTLALPQEGGIMDLTANALLRTLPWSPRTTLRTPSGDAAILALVGHAADAAAMVEPFATMLEGIGLGTVVKRTGDVWPGAPGCSLATSRRLVESAPDLVQRFVTAFVNGARHVREQPDDAAAVSARYIGVHARFVRQALALTPPDVDALSHDSAMDAVLELMLDLGYLERKPDSFRELRFLRALTCS